jgi:hypothetical protein
MKNLTEEEKKRIDEMSYYDMLRKWRLEPSMTGYFSGERGDYFSKVMVEKKAADPDAAVCASKDIGW